MNRNVKILTLSGLTVALITGFGYLKVKRMRESNEEESGET